MFFVLSNKKLFISSNLRDWLYLNLKKQLAFSNRDPWNLLFEVAVWKLWEWRNFLNISYSSFLKPINPAAVILRSWSRSVINHDVGGYVENLRFPQPVHWDRPPCGW